MDKPTTIELVLTAVLSAINGAIFVVWSNFVWDYLKLFTGLLFLPIVYGVWYIGATVPAYIVRKPGIALLGEFLAAVAELAYGSHYLTAPLYGFMQGLMSELVFAATRYRRWDWATMAAAGAAPSIWAAAADTLLYNIVAPLSPGQRIIFWSLYFISGALIAGVLVKAVIDAVAETGVLDHFAVGREARLASSRG